MNYISDGGWLAESTSTGTLAAHGSMKLSLNVLEIFSCVLSLIASISNAYSPSGKPSDLVSKLIVYIDPIFSRESLLSTTM